MTEKRLEEKLVQATRNRGGIAYKFTSPGRVGVPDRLVILPGDKKNGYKIGFVEVKKPGEGKLRKTQEKQLKKLTALKCKCYVLDDPNNIQNILNNINAGGFCDFPQWAYFEGYTEENFNE